MDVGSDSESQKNGCSDVSVSPALTSNLKGLIIIIVLGAEKMDQWFKKKSVYSSQRTRVLFLAPTSANSQPPRIPTSGDIMTLASGNTYIYM